MKTDYLRAGKYYKLFGVMQPQNVLAMRVALETGLRIDDVLKIRPSDIKNNVLTYTAEKTGKTGKKRISAPLCRALERNAGAEWVFEGRKRGEHRTRQAVWRDIKKAAKLLGFAENIAPHSARKTYAVELRRSEGLEKVQKELQHDRMGTTMIYAFADMLSEKPEKTSESVDFSAVCDQIAEKVVEKLLKSGFLGQK